MTRKTKIRMAAGAAVLVAFAAAGLVAVAGAAEARVAQVQLYSDWNHGDQHRSMNRWESNLEDNRWTNGRPMNNSISSITNTTTEYMCFYAEPNQQHLLVSLAPHQDSEYVGSQANDKISSFKPCPKHGSGAGTVRARLAEP